jgi:chromosome transmission fidelity protein 18
MARQLAKQCGYVPHVTNASDIRTGKGLFQVIKKANDQDSCFGEENKPNCIILDEVDGAVAGLSNDNGFASFIKNLEKSVLPGQKAKDKNSLVLRRPIIFVCNNLFCRALKPLREVAL